MDTPNAAGTTTPPTVTEKPEPKPKEKPKCDHCGKSMPNAGAKKMHEKACEKNPNRTPKKSKAGKTEVSGGDKGAVTPKKSGDSRPWYDRPIF